MNLEAVSTIDLKLAASAWREHAVGIATSRARAGILRRLMPEPDMSVYDRIDDLVAEVERLRWNEHLRQVKPVTS